MFRILSLDGGGVRGAFIAAFLAELESRCDKPLINYFDLIAGTSTGAVIAAALALGEPAAKAEDFFKQRVPIIFRRRSSIMPTRMPKGWVSKLNNIIPYVDLPWLYQSKYRTKELTQALTSVYGERTINDVKIRLLVPAVDMTRGMPVLFRTPHLPHSACPPETRLVDIVRAATAAPSFFAHAVIEEGSAYCDGGIWATNPSILGYAEAARIQETERARTGQTPFDLTDVHILSVGTGIPNRFVAPPKRDTGVIWWIPHIMDLLAGSLAQGTCSQAEYILGDRYYRVNFHVGGKQWKLDAVTGLDQLLKRGKSAAVEHFPQLVDTFLTVPVPSSSNRSAALPTIQT